MTPRTSAAAAVAALLILALSGCVGQLSGAPQASPTSPPIESASPTPIPSVAPTPDAVAGTCENTSTAEFKTMMASNEWVPWELPYAGIGGEAPFIDFPQGKPAGAISCRWGADPELATDNVLDLSSAPIDPDAASAAQDHLAAAGYDRIESPEGTYLAVKGGEGWPVDDEGYAYAYLFTDTDVRWATYKDELKFVKAPDEAG